MPTFHLHLYNTHIEAEDLEGHDLPNLDAARAAAIAAIREVLAHEAVAKGVIDLRGRVDIDEDGGEVLATVEFAEAIEIRSI